MNMRHAILATRRLGLMVLVLAVCMTGMSAQAELPRRTADQGKATLPSIPEPATGTVHDAPHERPRPGEMSPQAKAAEVSRELFGPSPNYADKPYDVEAQLAIYGNKHAVPGPRPPIEWGYPMYQPGPVGNGITLFGDKNLARPQLLAYGDFRLGTGYNDNGKDDTANMAVRLNLDLDLRLTATERIHAFLRPLDRTKVARVTRVEFGGYQRDRFGDHEVLLDATPESLFFEGDLGQIAAGITDKYNRYDIPIAFGLTPMVLQNGIWMDDAILGGAITIPALNSRLLDISNMDITFFGGADRVTSKSQLKGKAQDDHGANIYGTAIFIETRGMYIEAGYGYTEDTRNAFGADFSYHNLTAAVTRRYFGKVSNSLRVIYNFNQHPGAGFDKTADGWLLLMENAWISHKPLTLVPYANFFVGSKKPQSLARDFGAGGVLKNTGINFETDGLTGFPKLDDTANDTYGGALGIEYLFALDQQVVFEVAALNPLGRDNEAGRVAKGSQGAFGARYQRPLSKQWIFRTDAIYGLREHEQDLAGIRAELRLKF